VALDPVARPSHQPPRPRYRSGGDVVSRVTVTDQAGLDKALADKVSDIVIDSPVGAWLKLTDSGSSSVEASGSSRVEAWGSSRVVASGSSRVVAWGSSRVVAWGSSRVEASGSSRVEASGSSRVVASGSSSVEASGSSRVEAWGSSRVVARDSSSVEAWGSGSVEAGKYVAVHLHSQRVILSGGVVIDMTQVAPTDLGDWCDLTGVQIVDGRLTVYKAVDDDLRSGYGFEYPIGTEVTDTRWRDDHDCGGGLHFSPSPAAARAHFPEATHFLACTVAADEVRCIDASKLKAPRATVVREVTLWREPVEAAVVTW
jgi:hypothetical protein